MALLPIHGSTTYGSRNSGTTWIAVNVSVCAVTYGVLRRRMRAQPNSATHRQYATEYQKPAPPTETFSVPSSVDRSAKAPPSDAHHAGTANGNQPRAANASLMPKYTPPFFQW